MSRTESLERRLERIVRDNNVLTEGRKARLVGMMALIGKEKDPALQDQLLGEIDAIRVELSEEKLAEIQSYVNAIRGEMDAEKDLASEKRQAYEAELRNLDAIMNAGNGEVVVVTDVEEPSEELDAESPAEPIALKARVKQGARELLLPIKKGVKLTIGNEALMVPGEVPFVGEDLGTSDTAGELENVSSVLDDGRVVVQDEHGKEQFLAKAGAVTDEIGVGDRIRFRHGLVMEVVEKFKERMSSGPGIAKVEWSDVGGLQSLKMEIDDLLLAPLRNQEDLDLFPAGVLLHGVPGCGKDLMLRATMWHFSRQLASMGAEDPDSHIRVVHGPELLNEYVGVTERRIRTLYQDARQLAIDTQLPVLVCWSEPEAVLRTRGGAHGRLYDNCVTQWLSITDGLVKMGDEGGRVCTLLSTNRPDMLDSAVTRSGRIDRRVNIPRPDRHSSEEIFKIHIGKQADLEASQIDAMAMDCTEFTWTQQNILKINLQAKGEMVLDMPDVLSGALIEGAVKRAATTVRTEKRAGNKERVMLTDDIKEGVSSEVRSLAEMVTAENARNYFSDHINEGDRVVSVVGA